MAFYMVFMSTKTTLTRRETVHGLVQTPSIKHPASIIQHQASSMRFEVWP